MSKGVLLDGFPSMEEIISANGWPGDERFARGPVAIVECVQEIPCNPCESACAFNALAVGEPITNPPRLDFDKCTGCGLCVAACSGLCIFIVDKTYGESEGTISFPFEYLPLPKKGDTVEALARDGSFVCEATVVKVQDSVRNDHTPVVTIAVPKEKTDMVRTMKRLCLPESASSFVPNPDREMIDDDVVVCRCEEVTAGEVRRAIREHKATNLTELKRRVRCGMGLCQGKSCGKLVARIFQEELALGAERLPPCTDRPPVRPVTFGELAGAGEEERNG